MGRLDDKVALITGGAGDMGREIGRRFVEEGAKVVLADVQDDAGSAAAEELGDAAAYRHLDVTSEDDWAAAVSGVAGDHSRLDVLVNAAGIILMGPIAEMPLEAYRAVVEVNQTGTFLGMKAAIPELAKAGSGSIVNISSDDGLMGTPGAAAYCASKHAVIGLTKTAAIELAGMGIRANAICPGVVEGRMLETLAEQVGAPVHQAVAAKTPMKRLATPTEIANLAVYLAGDESAYCTGASYQVDGGLLAGISLD